MSALNRDELWQRLCGAGLAQGEAPAMPEQHAAWYVRAMLGVAGWIGAVFLLAFAGFGLSFVFDSGIVTLAVGAIWCAVAYAIFRAAPANTSPPSATSPAHRFCWRASAPRSASARRRRCSRTTTRF